MIFARILRSRRFLYMPTERTNSNKLIIPSHQSLKRSYSQSVAVATASSNLDSGPLPHQQHPSTMVPPRRPRKAAKVDESHQPRAFDSPFLRSSKQSSLSKGSTRGALPKDRARSRQLEKLDLPERDLAYIRQTFRQNTNPSAMVEENPKNALANFSLQILDKALSVHTQEGYIGRQKYIRYSDVLFLSKSNFYLSVPTPGLPLLF
jgi:hypothetical protein